LSRILYLNHWMLDQQRLKKSYPPAIFYGDGYGNQNWLHFLEMISVLADFSSLYCRTGTNFLPYKNDWIDPYGIGIPSYDPNFNLDFSTITDQHVHDLSKTKADKPWLICWSGGVDSTALVAAILKNRSQSDRSNIIIACNQFSVVENPRFFYNHIKPNFQIIDSEHLSIDHTILTKYYVFNGDLADQLYGPNVRVMMKDNGTSLLKDFRRDPDELIDYLSNTMFNPQLGKWLYENLRENIDSVDIPITSYFDFFWWMAFNLFWPFQKFQTMGRLIPADTSTSLEDFQSSHIEWYDTVEYQQWSMVSHLGARYSLDIAQRKLALKKYIYDLDHDEYYFHFKCKQSSTSRQGAGLRDPFICITDDGQRLHAADMDRVLEMLPDHINRT